MTKKIALAIDTNSAGGGERVMATLANYMCNKGYETYFVNSDTSSSFYSIDRRVRIYKMGLDLKYGNRLSRFIKKYLMLVQFFRKEKPDAVIAFLFNMEAPVILAGLTTHTNVFVSVRNSANSYPFIERVFRRFFYPHIKGIVFQSEKVRIHKDFKKLKNARVIMNPISGTIIEKRKPVPFSKRRNVIINVARLDEQKNQALLIKAFSKIENIYPEMELHIFGEGPLHNQLEELIESLNLSGKVFLKGAQKDAIFLNRDAKLFVLSSDYEGFPNALVEAMVEGIPSISTDFDSGVAAELIKNDRNGWLVAVNNVEQLANTISLALKKENQLDEISNESVDLFDLLKAQKICEEWERFVFDERFEG